MNLITVILFLLLQPLVVSTESDVTDIIISKITTDVENAYNKDFYRFTIIPKRIPGELEHEAKSIEQVSYSGRNMPKGYSTYSVIYNNGTELSKTSVQVLIEVNQKLPVPNQRISKGTPFTADMFSYIWIDITQTRGTFVSDVEGLDGYVAAGLLQAGRPIRPTDLGKIPLIEPGQTISMIFNQHGIQMVLQGTSRQDGAKNDEIRIYSEETRKTYLVRILNNREVLWLKTL